MTSDTEMYSWNRRYLQEGRCRVGMPPRKILLDWAHLLPERGLALDAAAGAGANGRFLAAHGLKVIAMDISEVGLRLAVAQTTNEILPLQAAVCDMALLHLPGESFDVIVNFFFLERATLPVYRHALKEGGVLYFETLLNHDASTAHPQYYLERGELMRAFADFEILHEAEGVVCGENKYSAQLIARKSAAPRRYA